MASAIFAAIPSTPLSNAILFLPSRSVVLTSQRALSPSYQLLLRTGGKDKKFSPRLCFVVRSSASAAADDQNEPPALAPPLPSSPSPISNLSSIMSNVSLPMRALLYSVTGLLAYLYFNGTLFGFHPTFMAVGYIFLMSEAVLYAIKAKGSQRKILINTHLLLQVLSAVAIAIGFGSIYQHKINMGKVHFRTIHAKMGLVATVLSAVVALGGIPAFFGLPSSLKKFTAVTNKAHKFFGAFVYAFGMATCVTGLKLTHKAHVTNKGVFGLALAFGMLLITSLVFSLSFPVVEAKKSWKGKVEKATAE